MTVARRVVERVRAYLMAFGCCALYEVDAFSVDAIAHGEECGLRPLVGQHVEHCGGGFGPGAVVERECHHFVLAYLRRNVSAHHVGRLLHDFFRRQAGDRAGFRALQSVGALPLEHVDRSAPFLFDRVGDAFLGGFARLFDGAAVAQFDHVAVVQLRIHVGSDFAVDGGVKRLALSCFDHRAVHGNEIAGFRLDAAGAQRVFQRLVTAYFQVGSIEGYGGRQALHDEVPSNGESGHYEQAGNDSNSAPPRLVGARRSMVTSWFLVGCRIARLLLCCVQAGAGGSGTCGLPGVVLVWS